MKKLKINWIKKLSFTLILITVMQNLIAPVSYAQTTYTAGSPQQTCQDVSCGVYTGSGINPNIRIKIESLIGNSVTFRIEKCSGTFGTSGTLKVFQDNCGGSAIKSKSISSGATGESFLSYTLTHTSGTKNFYGVFESSNGYKYYAGYVGISASTQSINAPTQVYPTQNQVLAYTTSSINFQWNKNNSSGVANYYISLRNLTTNTLLLNEYSVGDVSSYNYTGTGLTAGHSYRWVMKAVDQSNSSNYTYSTDFLFSINNSSTNCTFTDCSSLTNCGSTNYQDQTYNAIQYLCTHHIVKGDAGKANPDTLISRAQLAKILLYGIYGDSLNVPAVLVSDFFPSPYPDLQTTTTYYYRAAKALLYLEYTNGISPFDRGRINFSPEGKISRRWVMKAMLEAFNILPATSGTNPFTDINFDSSVEGWGYAKKAYDLGITTTTLFRPYENCTRAEAFIFLHRIMTTQSLPSINNTLVPSTSSFFIPANLTPSSFAANKGMETGNFNHYTKSSFIIPGRNVSLDFEHAYNSIMTELPVDLFPVNPLSDGWTHTYNSYIQKVAGETTADDRWIVLWPDASFNSYYKSGSTYISETKGVYDTYTEVSSTVFTIKTKSQITYTFTKIGSFNNVFFLTSISDRNNNVVTIIYETINSVPRVKEVVDPANRKLLFTYQSGSDLLWKVTDPLSRVITFLYTNNRLTSFKDAKNQTTVYNYGTTQAEIGLLKTIQLPKGNIINNEYIQRKLTSTKYNANNPTTINHNPNYQSGNTDFYKSTVTIPQQTGQNITTNYEINKNGNLTKASGNPALNISSQYNNSTHPSLPSSISNNNNGVTITPTYDSKGNITQLNTVGGSINTNEYFQYNTLNDVTQHTDANGNITYYTYTNGNLTKVKDALNNETNITNNTYGQPTIITNPNGVSVNFTYNSYGNQNQVSIPALNLTSTSVFDAASRMTSTTNFNGQTTSFAYDNNDNLTSETNALNHITTYAYDQNDNNLSITNAKGFATTFSYDNITDWLLTESFQGATKTYTYNYDGSLQTFQNPNGNTLSYTYDNAGRITNDGYASYTYLSNGNLSTITKGGKAITFTYDGLNRIYSVAYDGNTINYTYDNVGNLLTMTYPGSKTVTYTYDATNRMKTVKDWNNNTTTYYYRADGQLDYVLLPNNVKTTYTYDNAGRNTGQSTKRNSGSGTTIADYSFTLDPLGNHTQENITEPYASYIPIPNQTVNNTYNNANRILTAGNTSFGFDNNGNTTSKTGSTLSYDVLNNLTSVNGNFNASFAYDGAANRREATRNGVVTKYVLDILGMSNVLMETDGSGTAQNYYVYGLGLISRIKPNNTTHYYIYDYRGSTVAIVDANIAANITHKYQYDDFGKVLQLTESDYNPFRYVGKYGVMYEDSTLQFMRARYYDNSIGRFLSEDPIWSTNLYPYTNNNPIYYTDVLGLEIDQKRFDELYKKYNGIETTWDPKYTTKRIKQLKTKEMQNSMFILINIVKEEYGLNVRVTEGFRSVERSNQLVQAGKDAAPGGYSCHNYGIAIDLGVEKIINKKQTINQNLQNYPQIIEIAEKMGLYWGGNWQKNPKLPNYRKKGADNPHFQFQDLNKACTPKNNK